MGLKLSILYSLIRRKTMLLYKLRFNKVLNPKLFKETDPKPNWSLVSPPSNWATLLSATQPHLPKNFSFPQFLFPRTFSPLMMSKPRWQANISWHQEEEEDDDDDRRGGESGKGWDGEKFLLSNWGWNNLRSNLGKRRSSSHFEFESNRVFRDSNPAPSKAAILQSDLCLVLRY